MYRLLLPLLMIIAQALNVWGYTSPRANASACAGAYQPTINLPHTFRVIEHETALFGQALGTNSADYSSFGQPGIERQALQLRSVGYAWARVYAPSHSANSFWLQLGNAKPIIWNLPVAAAFQWALLPIGVVDNSPLVIASRESGTLLDTVAVLPLGCPPKDEDALQAIADTPFDPNAGPTGPWDVFDQYWLGYGHALRSWAPAIYFCDTSNLATGWWHNWTAQFANPADKTYVPIHWGYPGEPLAWLRPYNDGRPLLLLNEPDVPSQANLSPQQAADKLKGVIDFGWQGDIYFGGFVFIDNFAYIDAVYTSFEQRFGPVPANVYNQIHLYTGTRSTAEMFGQSEEAVNTVKAFIAHQRARDRSTRTLITELGALSTAKYRSADYAGLLLGLTERLREVPEVVGVAWYVSCYGSTDADPTGIGRDSSLVERFSDRLTPLGRVWNLAADLYQRPR